MQQAHDASAMPDIKGKKIVILQSKWYREYTDVVTARCLAMLEGAGAEVVTHIVPGCLEIPLIAQKFIKRDAPDAVVCVGVLMKGETHHYEMILQSCSWGMQKVSLDFDVPLINGILPVTSLEHVKARCADNESNKGIELALATGEYLQWSKV